MILNKYRIRFEKSLIQRINAFLLDTLGLPFVFFNQSRPKEIKKILIIRKDEIGDIVLSIPIYEAIKTKYPGAEIVVLCSRLTSEILKNNPYVDRIIKIDDFLDNEKLNLYTLIKCIKKEEFDIGIDPKGSIVNILIMYFAGIKQRISYYNVSGGKFLLTDHVFYERQIHEIEANLELLKTIGINRKVFFPKIYLTNEEEKHVRGLVKKARLKKFVLVYSIPSKKCKEWPLENFNKLVKLFPKINFLFTGIEKDRTQIERIIQENKNCVSLYDYNLRKLSYLACLAEAVVAVDGGPMHLSWIANKKTISLFGQNDIELWRPLNKGRVISHLPESEQGLNRRKLYLNEENEYMSMINVEEVARALREKLK
jgi:ADP-heptose:LPS heptosyltransferase